MKLCIAVVLFAVAACDVPPETTAYAHESPPWDAPTDAFEPPVHNLQLSRKLGGSGSDEITALVATGTLYPQVVVAGGTDSSDFVTTDGTQVDTSTTAGCSACPSDAFVTRLRGPGDVAWSTVIGGPGFERASAIAFAADGDVFVGGSAASLSATTGAADATFAGGTTAERGAEDGFVCRLDGETGARMWCTFVGGNGSGGVHGLVADANGDDVIVVLTTAAGEALDGDASYTAAFAGRHRATARGADTVMIRVSGDGQVFEWATYVGGTGDESGSASVVLDGGGVHVLTTTSSTDAPTPGGRITTAPAGRNGYFATFAPDATTLRYGTYLGGGGDDWTPPNALAASAVVYAAINTSSTDLPVPNAVQATYGGGAASADCGGGDGWIGALRPEQTGAASLVSATYMGGARGDEVGGLAVLGNGELVVTGRTYSSDFPLTAQYVAQLPTLSGSACTSAPGNSDGFVVRFKAAPDPALSSRRMATYLGGRAADALGVAASPGNGDFHVLGGWTQSIDFPRRGLPQMDLNGPRDGALVAPEYWREMSTPVDPDAGTDGPVAPVDAGRDGGNGADDGDGGCCGASGGPASSAILLVLAALAALARPTSRGRRARGGTASARDRAAP